MTFLRDLFRTPEAQSDPHYWAATFGGHVYIALLPWGIVAIGWDMWTAAVVVSLAYFVLWEGAQFYFAPRRSWALFWDCVLDAVAVAFGCHAAAALGSGMKELAVMSLVASLAVVSAGVVKRS